MIPLNHLQQLSKQKKKQKKYDGTITGLVWRISATGQVSAAYRIAPQHGRKEVNNDAYGGNEADEADEEGEDEEDEEDGEYEEIEAGEDEDKYHKGIYGQSVG